MTTSKNKSFELNLLEIGTDILQLIGQTHPDQNPRQQDLNTVYKTVRIMLDSWRAQFPFLWKRNWLTLKLTQSNFVIDSNGNCQECIKNHISTASDEPIIGNFYLGYWVQRYLAWTDNASYSNGNIVVGSDNLLYECVLAHISSVSNKPITGGSYATYWSLVTTITPTAWSNTIEYKSIANIDLEFYVTGVGTCFLRKLDDSSNNQLIDDPLDIKLTTKEYFDKTDKTIQNKPTSIYFRRRAISSSQGQTGLFLYPFPDSATEYSLSLEVYEFPDDLEYAKNTPDYWKEWTAAIIYNAAVMAHPKFKTLSPSEVNEISKIADRYLLIASGSDEETGNLRMYPNLD